MNPKAGSLAAVAITLLIPLGACASSSLDDRAKHSSAATTTTLAYATYERDGLQMLAQLRGTAQDLGGCVVIITDVGGDLVLPVFPTGGKQIDTIEIGQPVELGGGYRDQPPSGATIPNDCVDLTDKYFIVSDM